MRRPPRPPLTPAGRRDSVELSARIDRAIDSLVAAGGVERPALDSAKTTILSGGVFQNARLVDEICARIPVFTHQRVPPNDGGIALGQAILSGSEPCV